MLSVNPPGGEGLYINQPLKRILGAFQFANGEWIVPCRHMDIMPDIDFTLNGKVYTLTPEDYVMKLSAEGIFQNREIE